MNNKQEQQLPILGEGFIKNNKLEVNHYEVFLDEEIGESPKYRDLISLLFNAGENDRFTMFINTPGGYLTTTRAIVEGMKHTNADVNGILIGETHSGGSLIAMYCHGLAVLDSAEMMIHTATFGSAGFTGNVKAHTDFTLAQVEKLIDDAYEGFLTKEEIVDVKKGVEIWLDAEQIRTRMERRVKVLEKKYSKVDQREAEVAKTIVKRPKKAS